MENKFNLKPGDNVFRILPEKHVKQFPNKSIRFNIENLALFCLQEASKDKVGSSRRDAFEKTSKALQKIAISTSVTRLLNYME